MNQSIDLEAAKAAFFACGGQLVVLEGFTYRQLPQRKHPEPKSKRAKPTAHKMANPFASHTFHGAWFLAGWNDMDLEIEQKNPRRAAKNKAA